MQAGIKSPDKNTFFIEFESKWHFDANFIENTKTRYNNDSSSQFRIISASKMSVLNKETMRLTTAAKILPVFYDLGKKFLFLEQKYS